MIANEQVVTKRPGANAWLATLLAAVVIVGGGILIGWLACLTAMQGFSPIVLFSLLIGAACGLVAVLVTGALGVPGRRKLFVLAILTAATAVTAQHVSFYLATAAQRRADLERVPAELRIRLQDEQALVVPSFSEFLTSSTWTQWLWWIADAGMAIAAAFAVAWYSARRPVCPDCRVPMACLRHGHIAGAPLQHVWSQLLTEAEAAPHAEAAFYELWRCPRCGEHPRLRLFTRRGRRTVRREAALTANQEADVLRMLAGDIGEKQS